MSRIRQALEEATGSPIKKDRIVRHFAAKLLHGELGEGQGECTPNHALHGFGASSLRHKVESVTGLLGASGDLLPPDA